MADGRGGYRRPSNPAPVSGPGALSKRTDGRQPTRALSDARYGEQQAFQAAQQAAPMAETPGGNAAGMGAPALPDLSGLTPMDAPTAFPDQPITAGMPTGPGAGSINAPSEPTITPEQANKLRSYIPTLVLLASRDDASPATKQFVRNLRAQLG